MTLREYLELPPENRIVLDPMRALNDAAQRHAKHLRDLAIKVEKLSPGSATDLRDAATWMVGK